jgi:hypothetical protein
MCCPCPFPQLDGISSCFMFMSISMLHVQVDPAHALTCKRDMDMGQGHRHAEWTLTCNVDMDKTWT